MSFVLPFVLLSLALGTTDVGAQKSELPLPILVSAELPLYPPIARAARVEGDVHIAFTLGENGKPVNIRVVSGNPVLVEAATHNVKTWTLEKPHDLFRTNWEYETVFRYRTTGKELDCYRTPPQQRVDYSTFQDFVITSDICKPIIQTSVTK